jgi:hypothetical protein
VAVLCAGLLLGLAVGTEGPRPRVRFAKPARAVVAHAPAATPAPVADATRRSGHRRARHARPRRPAPPVRVIIPAIAVRARVVRLGLNPDRTLQTPKDFTTTGWWSGGPRPGERGAAVIVGHVDSQTGPAVFYALSRLRRGDGIHVIGADGRSARFVVQRLAHFPKARFPTRQVYGRTRWPTLRLVTCSGAFDASSGHYLDNTVVFARATRGS